MMDIYTDTSIIQERIGQLCYQFKLPTGGGGSYTAFHCCRPRRRPAHPA